MSAFPDHYAALGIDPTADQEVIAAAYRALAKKFHPDTGATSGTASAERFDQVQQAYEVLRTPASRRRYDLELLAETERELEEHLARKQRVLSGKTEAPRAGKPDLGAIRPEPRGRRQAAKASPGRRPIGPFLIPAALLLAVTFGVAWLFLPPALQAPEAPVQTPLFGSSATDGEAMPAETVQAETKTDTAPVPPPVPETDSARPLFGTSFSDEQAAAIPENMPDAIPAPMSEAMQDTVAEPPPLPTPKPQPVAQRQAANASYTLVIFERGENGSTAAEQGSVVFSSLGSCTAFGVKSVLRRLSAAEAEAANPRIWYECHQAP